MTVIKIRTRAALEDRPTLVAYIAQQLNRSRIALILGAGVSREFGLPDWPGLVERLYKQDSKLRRDATLDLKRQVEIYRATKFGTDVAAYMNAVKKALYKDTNTTFKSLRANDLLDAIGALVMNSARGTAGAVITFNFDDLVELFLDYHGVVVESVSRPHQWANRSDVAVLHPHGLLPLRATAPGPDLIFDQASFAALVGNDASPWRQTLLSVMRRYTCLFIGLSGTDDHLDSLMNAVASSHASSLTGERYWGITFSKRDTTKGASRGKTRRKRGMDVIWEQRKVFVHEVNDYAQIPELLFECCQYAAKNRG